MPRDYGFGSLTYLVNSDGKALYVLKKSGLPKEVQDKMNGGSDEGKSYVDFQELNDVYGVTSDLKVYYSSGVGANLVALTDIELDNDILTRKVFDSTMGNGYYNTLSGFDADNNGEISADEVKSVKTLTIDSSSGISSLSNLYNLVSLQKLIIENKELSSLDGIQNCPHLYYIYFKSCTIGNYSAISNLGSKLQYLYFYNIDDNELNTACDGIKDAKFTNMQYLGVSGDTWWLELLLGSLDHNGTHSGKSAKTITTLEPLSKLSNETKLAVRYLIICNNNIIDDNLTYISEYKNVYLLRAEFNSLKSLYGIKNWKRLTYLYASNNQLGTDCLEDGTDETRDCLSSLANMSKANSDSGKYGLYYVNLRYNNNLKYVDYFKNDTNIRHLYLASCSSSMSVNNISNIITACNGNYDLPCKFLNGNRYIWSDYFVRGAASGDKQTLTADLLKSDLLNNSTITHLNLSGCYTGVDSTEITNEVLNEILCSMPQLKYVRLDSTKLSTLDFCGIKNGTGNMNTDLANKNLYAYCPNLIELDLRNTYVTDISNLNCVIKKTNTNPNGRNMGTLRLNNSLAKVNGVSQLVNLPSIQNVINGLTADCYWLKGGWNGLVITGFNTMKLLEECTNLTIIRSYQYSSTCSSNTGVVDLTGLTNLKEISTSGWYFTYKLPSSVTSWAGDQAFPPVLGTGSKLSGVLLTTSYNGVNIGAERWRNFFKSCEACESIETLRISRARGFSSDYFKDTGGNVIFTGSKVGKLIFTGMLVHDDEFENLTNLNGFEVLTGVKNLEFARLNHLTDYSGISTLTNLTILNITDCHFNYSSALANLTNLKTLIISNNLKLVDIKELSTLTGLTSLTITNCSISSCVPLKNMTNLTYLNLQNNAIGERSDDNGTSVKNLDILENLHKSKNGKLERLYLKGNSGLSGIIESHEILTLPWTNNTESGGTRIW